MCEDDSPFATNLPRRPKDVDRGLEAWKNPPEWLFFSNLLSRIAFVQGIELQANPNPRWQLHISQVDLLRIGLPPKWTNLIVVQVLTKQSLIAKFEPPMLLASYSVLPRNFAKLEQ